MHNPHSIHSFALELNSPPPFLYQLLRPIKRTYYSCAPFGFSLANDAVGSPTTFSFHKIKSVLAEGGEHRALSFFKRIDDDPTRVVLLNDFCAIGTASNG
jgi:hypothetical protein